MTTKTSTHARPDAHMFTPARLVVLALIAVLVGVLMYLRFASEAERVAVPDGAKADDLMLAT